MQRSSCLLVRALLCEDVLRRSVAAWEKQISKPNTSFEISCLGGFRERKSERRFWKVFSSGLLFRTVLASIRFDSTDRGFRLVSRSWRQVAIAQSPFSHFPSAYYSWYVFVGKTKQTTTPTAMERVICSGNMTRDTKFAYKNLFGYFPTEV